MPGSKTSLVESTSRPYNPPEINHKNRPKARDNLSSRSMTTGMPRASHSGTRRNVPVCTPPSITVKFSVSQLGGFSKSCASSSKMTWSKAYGDITVVFVSGIIASPENGRWFLTGRVFCVVRCGGVGSLQRRAPKVVINADSNDEKGFFGMTSCFPEAGLELLA